jgi:hypothetical protein
MEGNNSENRAQSRTIQRTGIGKKTELIINDININVV